MNFQPATRHRPGKNADGGERLREDAERHFKDEYSTYDWVLDGLLAGNGFLIKSKQIEGGVLGTYLCTRS